MKKKFVSINFAVIILVSLLCQPTLGVVQNLKGRLGLDVCIGQGWFNLKEYNNSIQEYNEVVGTNSRDIKRGLDIGFFVNYGLTENILIKAGVSYLPPLKSSGHGVDFVELYDEMGVPVGLARWEANVKREISVIPVTVETFYLLKSLSNKKVNTLIGGGLGYYFGKSVYSYSDTLFAPEIISFSRKIRYKGESLGFHLAGNVEYAINSHWALGFETIYRFVKIKEMKDSEGKVDKKVFKNETLPYDLSGPGIRLSLIYFF